MWHFQQFDVKYSRIFEECAKMSDYLTMFTGSNAVLGKIL